MDITFLHRFGTAVNNLKALLKDRGYRTEDFVCGATGLETSGLLYTRALQKKCSFAEALHQSFGSLSIWALDRNYDPIKCKERMVSTDQIKHLGESIASSNSRTHLVLCPNKMSPQAKKEASLLNATFFVVDELLIDLPRHELVSAHYEISSETAKKYLGESLQPSDLPVIPLSDPMVRHYGFKEGSIIYIDGHTMPSYRIVGH